MNKNKSRLFKKSLKILIFVFSFVFLLFPKAVFAHEQYVLTKHQLDVGFADKNTHVLDALKNSANLQLAIIVGVGILIVGSLYFFFQYSVLGKAIDKKLNSLENFGHFLIRISLAISLLASAYFHAFLGPEIPLKSIFLGNLLVPVMYTLGLLLLFGIFTRATSFLGLLILLAATFVYKDYMFTYFNYFGEYLALIIFGSYFLCVDKKMFGISKLIEKYKDLEILILRVTFGISVLYPAITIKLLHPRVIIEIYNQYHLGNIWWLFPKDALLTSLGTGLAQILVGALLIFGFETRLAAIVTFLLYLGSVLYFQEAVWPHVVLLALSFYFVINNGGGLTTERLIEKLKAKFFVKKEIQETEKVAL